MRKIALSLFLVGLGFFTANAQGLDLDAFLRLTIDPVSQTNSDDTIMSSRVGVSVAYDKGIRSMISPGGAIQIGFFPLGSMLKEKVILFDVSGRIFNGMRFGSVELQPFGGYTLQTTSANGVFYSSGKPEAGLAMIVGVVGFECAYLFPGNGITVPAFGTVSSDLHIAGSGGAIRIGVAWHLRDRKGE